MIDKFGRIMLYVENVRNGANFWINNLEFIEIDTMILDNKLISLELSPTENSDTNLVLFDREFVEKNSPMINLDTPSILFSTYDIKEMHTKLLANGVEANDIMDIAGELIFNFKDNENNYFAVREISKE